MPLDWRISLVENANGVELFGQFLGLVGERGDGLFRVGEVRVGGAQQLLEFVDSFDELAAVDFANVVAEDAFDAFA